MSDVLAVLAGTARLSRRDRAALTLALECVRSGDLASAVVACAYGHVLGVAREIWRTAWPSDERAHVRRVERARLALLLRLVLRCDAGKPPLAWRSTWSTREYQYATRDIAEWWQRRRALHPHPKNADGGIERIVPLWERAPATRAR